MIKGTIRHTALLASLLGLLLLSASNCFAQKGPIVHVRVDSKTKPIAAEGLLFMDRGIQRVPNAEISELGDNQYLVSFRFRANDTARQVLASAAVIDENQSRIFGTVVDPFIAKKSMHALPVCPPRSQLKPRSKNNNGLFKELVQLRIQKRDLRVQKIESVLTPDFAERLNTLEYSLGLRYPEPISATTHPLKLIDRFNRLKNAIQSFKAHKHATQLRKASEQAAMTDEERSLENVSAEFSGDEAAPSSDGASVS